MQFNVPLSCKKMYNVLKYYIKDINLEKCYTIGSFQIRICCLDNNMINLINVMSKIVGLNVDFFNEFKNEKTYFISENDIMGRMFFGRIMKRYVTDIY